MFMHFHPVSQDTFENDPQIDLIDFKIQTVLLYEFQSAFQHSGNIPTCSFSENCISLNYIIMCMNAGIV